MSNDSEKPGETLAVMIEKFREDARRVLEANGPRIAAIFRELQESVKGRRP